MAYKHYWSHCENTDDLASWSTAVFGVDEETGEPNFAWNYGLAEKGSPYIQQGTDEETGEPIMVKDPNSKETLAMLALTQEFVDEFIHVTTKIDEYFEIALPNGTFHRLYPLEFYPTINDFSHNCYPSSIARLTGV